MTIIDDAGKVWHRLWDVRLGFASALCGGAAAALPFVAPDHPSRGFAVALFAVTVAAPLLAMASAGTRAMKQRKAKGARNG